MCFQKIQSMTPSKLATFYNVQDKDALKISIGLGNKKISKLICVYNTVTIIQNSRLALFYNCLPIAKNLIKISKNE